MIDIKQIHEIQLDMLKVIDGLANKLNLQYFLTGGSAIGAVRHHGFIPWNDDIDIGLTRKDFEKFVKLMPDYLSKFGLFLEEDRLDPKFEFDFAKVMRADTSILERGREDTNTKDGIFIDVFPFDKMPESKVDQNNQKNALNKINRVITNKVYPERDHVDGSSKLLKDWRLTDLYLRRLSIMENYDDQRSLPNVNMSSPYGYGKEVILQSELSDGVVKRVFEGYQFPILKDYDSYLRRLYGNYMKLPPEAKRYQRHILQVSFEADSDGLNLNNDQQIS